LASSVTDVQALSADPVAGLIDISLPPEVSLWPQTWPARIALALLVVAAIIAAWQFARRWRANRYRRQALAELKQITHTLKDSPQELTTRVSLLVRRTALAAFPREQVAPLSGAAWLGFLDHTSGRTEFSRGAGRCLASAPYARTEPDDNQEAALIDLTRYWIRCHHA
jgi:Domain of unknown function (DUF4381)